MQARLRKRYNEPLIRQRAVEISIDKIMLPVAALRKMQNKMVSCVKA